MSKVDNYLKKLKIKKTRFGGFDETDVYNVLQNVCDIYEEEIREIQSNNTKQMAQYENNVKKEIRELTEKVKRLKRSNESYHRENERLMGTVSSCVTIKEELCKQAEIEAEKVREQVTKEANNIIAQAEKEAERIREQARKEANQICKDSKKEKMELEKQNEDLKGAQKNLIQSLNVIQRFCVRTQKEIQVLKGQDTDKRKEAIGKAEGLKESTDMYGEHLRKKIEGQPKNGDITTRI